MDQAQDTRAQFCSTFPLFGGHPDLVRDLLEQSRRLTVPAGTHLYWEGDACSGIAFLFSGEIRVYKCGESGREITLYEIGPGETCILNASCILGSNAYPANAATATEVELLLVPAQVFSRLLGVHEPLRAFVFSILSERLAEVMHLVNEVAFARMDQRLYDYLVEKSCDGVLQATHQKIANDLGSSREVISRLLKDLQLQGKVALARNEVRVTELIT